MQAKLQVDNIIEAFRRLNVPLGATVFVHSFVGAFGVFENGLETVLSGLRSTVGPTGTLIMPTYNYSFCKGTPYDPVGSISEVGQLTEYFRTQPGVQRSFHPVYSHAVEGRLQRFYCENPSLSAFGANSFFARFRQDDGWYVFMGVTMHNATMIHYVEEHVGAPYRFIKNFVGDVVDSAQHPTRMKTVTVPIFSRYLELKLELNMIPFQDALLASGKAIVSELGRGRIIAVRASTFFDEAISFYQANMFSFLKHPVDLQQIQQIENPA